MPKVYVCIDGPAEPHRVRLPDAVQPGDTVHIRNPLGCDSLNPEHWSGSPIGFSGRTRWEQAPEVYAYRVNGDHALLYLGDLADG